jgi:sugar lactone lactonase YvrE
MAIRKIAGGIVTTLAGSGFAGYADGPGTTARFHYPQSVAVDSAGNVYVCDEYNKRIREVSPSGMVSTLAGNGTQGFVDGPGTSAEFNNLSDLVADTFGNVYVSDNNSVREITPTGFVSTIAGNGTAGNVDGTGTVAQFNNPYGLAFDSIGNLYINDASNERVRKMTSAGVVTTFAGNGTNGTLNGPGLSAEFENPAGLALDTIGNLYVADEQNSIIRKISP